MTEKLYEQDAHLARFSARVLSCDETKHGYEVVLDRTAFYPEGGGQPGDTGTIAGIPVTDTHASDGMVRHYCAAPLAVGAEVEGEIDWQRRFDLMQQHSGEHIVSGLVHKQFGYDNVGFHMGAEMITIDFSGPISMEALREIESAANEAVRRNLPVQIDYPDEAALSQIPYRSKKELTGQVRIVTIPGVDICACCGTHVRATGEIGLIRIFSAEKFHAGVRVQMLCGRRAFAYETALLEQNRRISALLSARPGETAEAVERTLEELSAMKLHAAQLEDRLFAEKAALLAGARNALVFEEGLSPDGVRRLADAVMRKTTGLVAVFSGSDTTGYHYAVCQQNGALREFTQRLNEALHGRGGGKPFFVQGSVRSRRCEIEAFFQGEDR